MPSLLSSLPPIDPDTSDLVAVIETPKGSPNKYKLRRGMWGFQVEHGDAQGQLLPL